VSTHSLIEVALAGLDDEAAQLVINLFDQWGRGGAVVEQIVGEDAVSIVKTYLPSEDDDGLRQIQIGLELLKRAHDAPCSDSVSPERLPEPRIRFLAETDWAEAWKTSYHVLHVGRRLVIRPTWRDYTPQPADLVISLDPSMAFGSGLHPTTRLCLEALEDYLSPGAIVLDVGTGSGILAIAAARLGASGVLALDTDPLAVQIARENAALNQVESVVDVQLGTIQTANGKYQISNLIVANILAETIVDLMPTLVANLSSEGILVASGIIAERADAVVASLRGNGLSLAERRDDGEWVALIARV
jgi:ribosomal protein L11 methyltransferase